MSVTLVKASDRSDVDTVTEALMSALPPLASFDDLHRAFVNLPTLVKGQSSTTNHAEPVDYSDGYGGTYAKGE